MTTRYSVTVRLVPSKIGSSKKEIPSRESEAACRKIAPTRNKMLGSTHLIIFSYILSYFAHRSYEKRHQIRMFLEALTNNCILKAPKNRLFVFLIAFASSISLHDRSSHEQMKKTVKSNLNPRRGFLWMLHILALSKINVIRARF